MLCNTKQYFVNKLVAVLINHLGRSTAFLVRAATDGVIEKRQQEMAKSCTFGLFRRRRYFQCINNININFL